MRRKIWCGMVLLSLLLCGISAIGAAIDGEYRTAVVIVAIIALGAAAFVALTGRTES